MRKILMCTIALLSAALVACETNNPPEPVVTPTPVFAVPAAPGVGATTAILTCTYTYTGTIAVEEAGISYKKASDTNYTAAEAASYASPLTVGLEELAPDTEYLFFAYVMIEGEWHNSEVGAFTTNKLGTDPEEPQFAVPAVDAVGNTTATLSCVYTYAGDIAVEEAGISYKKASDTNYTPAEAASYASPLVVSIDGLASGTEYQFFACVMIDGEWYNSSVMTFTTGKGGTDDPVEPQFGALSVTNLETASATLNGSFTYTGTEAISQVGFEYRRSGDSGYTPVATTASVGSKSVNVSSLAASTAYSYRLYTVIGGTRYQSAESTFTTKTSPIVDGVYRTGWPELPVEVQKSGDYYYAHHMRADAGSIRNFTICYSADYRSAVWTAHAMHKSWDGSAGRNDQWGYDPIIPQSVQPNLGSSYSATGSGSFSRGHMVASSDRQVSVATNKQTFYYTNMAPQTQNSFNGGIWNKLEIKIQDTWICSDTLYVVTGSHWANTNSTCQDNSKKTVTVPTHFYKVLIRSKAGNTGKPISQLPADQVQCVAFWFTHKEGYYANNAAPSSAQMRSVADVEQETGMTFFPNIPDAPKSTYKAGDWGM